MPTVSKAVTSVSLEPKKNAEILLGCHGQDEGENISKTNVCMEAYGLKVNLFENCKCREV